MGVGVVEICLRNVGGSLDQGGWRLLSDLLAVSILPAVSIEVDFEVAPKFELLLPLRSSHEALVRAERGPEKEGEEDNGNKSQQKRSAQLSVVEMRSKSLRNKKRSISRESEDAKAEGTTFAATESGLYPTESEDLDSRTTTTESVTATTNPGNSEQSELRQDFGWSSNAAAAAAVLATKPQQRALHQRVKISCARLIGRKTKKQNYSIVNLPLLHQTVR